MPEMFDTLIVGAGPAGCSAAAWASQLGWRVAVVDREAGACATLARLEFEQGWVLGHPHTALRELGARYADHARALPGIAWHLGQAVSGLQRSADASWLVQLGNGAALSTRSLVLATGLRPLRPALYFGAGLGERVMDAITLTQRRAALARGRVLLLGGGDNALENAAWLSERGHAVTLWARTGWSGRPSLVAGLEAHPGIVQRADRAMPTALRLQADGIVVDSAGLGSDTFDHVAVLFGYEPEPAPWGWLQQALRDDEHALMPAFKPGRAIEALGVFVAGDASGRGHPCVQTALADGVTAARQVAHFLDTARQAGAPLAPGTLTTLNSQILQLTGLRFGANLGVLAHERDGPQPIQVDAELNLGGQPALARDAGLTHVLDYRKVRQIIIDECTAEHTDLLESLLAKLCVRLMRLPGVQGVRIRVAKLEIFDDCEVAIRCEAGEW
jgi:dihydroneopterin aldolase